jgi:hypothetical protein
MAGGNAGRQRIPGGNPPMRPDQLAAQGMSRSGTGPAPQNVVIVGRTVIVFGPVGSVVGVFVYQAGTTPGAGNPPILSMTANTSDPFGNPVESGITSQEPSSVFAQLATGQLRLGSTNPLTEIAAAALLEVLDVTTAASRPAVELISPATSAGNTADLTLFGESADASGAAQVVISAGLPLPSTTALLEVDGEIAAVGGDLLAATAGRGLRIQGGPNARIGISVLAAGTVTVANTTVTANTKIFLTAQSTGPNSGFLGCSARVPGTSFTILSSNGADGNSVAWLLIEPS